MLVLLNSSFAVSAALAVTSARLTVFGPLRRQAIGDVECSRESPREFIDTSSKQ
jgi:hypothetical protein